MGVWRYHGSWHGGSPDVRPCVVNSRVYRLLYIGLDLRKKTCFYINSNLQTYSKAQTQQAMADIGLWQMMQEPKTPRTTSRKDYISALWSEHKSEQFKQDVWTCTDWSRRAIRQSARPHAWRDSCRESNRAATYSSAVVDQNASNESQQFD